MAFTDDAIARQQSERYMLVRVNPARHVSDDLSLSGGVYQAAFSFTMVGKVTRQGVTLTEVTGVPGSNDEWSYDESSGLFQIKLASAPDADTNAIVVFHSLFFSSGEYRYLGTDPTQVISTSNVRREWEPRVQREPDVKASYKDIINGGVFSLQASGVSLINHDSFVQDYLGPEDSWNRKVITYWLVVDGEVQKTFTGRVSGVRISRRTVSLTVYNTFNAITDPALMGDLEKQAYFKRGESTGIGSHTNGDPSKQDRPIPLVMGSQSRYKIKQGAALTGTSPLVYEELEAAPVSVALCEAINLNIQAPASTGNRDWLLCRTTGSLPTWTPSLGDLTRVAQATIGGTTYTLWYFPAGSPLTSGDYLRWNDTIVGDDYGFIVNANTSFTYSGSTYNMITLGSGPTAKVDVNNFRLSASIAIWISKPSRTSSVYGDDGIPADSMVFGEEYSTLNVTTENGHKLYYIEFATGAINTSLGSELDPQTDRVFYRIGNDASALHGDVLSSMMTAAGISVDASSITAANSALAVDARFMIPEFDQGDYQNYAFYIERLLSSTAGYIYPDEDGDAVYKLLASPAGGGVEVSADNYRALMIEVGYGDMVNQIVATNPNILTEGAIGESSSTEEDNRSKWLHEISVTTRFRHVLEDISTRLDDIIAVRSAPEKTYVFETATDNLNTILSDDIDMTSDEVLGTGSQDNLKVITIERSSERTRLKATDLGDL